MPRTRAASVTTALVSIALGAAAAFAEKPPAFSDLAFPEALAANAEREGSLLVVKFTAEWCAPCKAMDRTTWSDQRVVDYLRDHGITAIPVDVDEHPGIARDHAVRAMPTTVVFRAGEEIGRHTGGMSAEAMTDWLDGAREGRLEPAEAPRHQELFELHERAIDMVFNDRAGEAAPLLLEMWDRADEWGLGTEMIRENMLPFPMNMAAEKDPVARAAFERLRDGREASLREGRTDRATLGEWIVLNLEVLEDEAPVKAWIERIKDRPTAADTVRAFSGRLAAPLLEWGHWELAGHAQEPALGVVLGARFARGFMLENEEDEDPGFAKELRQHADRAFIDQLAKAHAAYLAAGREPEAWYAADSLLKDLPTHAARKALCEAAETAGVLRPRHAEIAGPLGEAFVERVRAGASDPEPKRPRAPTPDA